MKNIEKTKEQFTIERSQTHQRNAELEMLLTDEKRAEQAMREACEYVESIATTVREPLLVLDADLRVVLANHSFYLTFGVKPEETQGRFIYDLGGQQWESPRLRELLEEILPRNISFYDFEVDHNFPALGHKVMVLNARRLLYSDPEKAPLILLAIQDVTEKKQAEERLFVSETRYRRLFETAQDGILILDADTGKIIDVNPFLVEMLGYSKEEFLGKKLWEIGPFKDIELNQEAFQELQSKGYIRYEHLPLETKNGHQISVEFVSNVYPIDGDRVIQCNIRDITERKRAEDALAEAKNELETRVKERTSQLAKANEELVQEIDERKRVEESLASSERKYRQLVEKMREGVWIIDKDACTSFANPRMAEMLGYTVDEMQGKPLFSFMDEHGVEIAKRLLEHRSQGIVEQHDFEFMRKDGRRVYVILETSPLSDATGNYLGALGCATDITERRQAEEALKTSTEALTASEKRYSTIFQSAAEGILIADIATKQFKYANPAICKMLGYSQEELKKMTLGDIHPKDSLKHVVSEFEAQARGDKTLAEGLPCLRKDGTILYADINSAGALLDGMQCNIGFFTDATERKQAEEELQKVSKLESISTLAGGIAHDFNNLLTGILGNITLAERYVNKGGKIHDRLIDAEKASLRARDLTQQLLTFSGGGAPIKKPASMPTLVKESVSFALSGSNVRCDFCMQDDLWAADVDEAQISRVINNIVINADQAMPQGGLISIMAKNMAIKHRGYLPLPKGNYLEIAIKDCGIGMPKEHLSRIFEPYFTTKQKGRGLGLPTAYSIIKNHGGYMTAKSKLGVGTTIYIYIPATTEPVPVVAETADGVSIGGKGRILVMDDEEMIRDLLHNGLSEVGYDIELAVDGTEAIEKYAKAEKSGDKFDAVIMDLTIPGGMGGKETIKKLLEIDPNVKAIASSGYANGKVMANFKRYGFVGAVTKPYRITELEKTLSNVISTSESEKAVHKRRKVQENPGTGRARILVMDDAQVVTMALGENLSDLGYEVEIARNGDEAISMYMKALESGHSFDVVLIDLTISDGLGGEETIRRLIEIDPEIRAIVTSGYPTKPAMMKPEEFGFRTAIAKPYSVEELGEVLHRVIEGEN